MARCAVLRRHAGNVNIHGNAVPRYEHRVVVLAPDQSEDFDQDRGSRLWLHPWLGEGWHLMEFVDLLHQEEPAPKLGDGTPDASLAIVEHAFRAGFNDGMAIGRDVGSGKRAWSSLDEDKAWSNYDPPSISRS